MVFKLGIPTIKRADLLILLLKHLVKDYSLFNSIHIIDNGNQKLSELLPALPNLKIELPTTNLGVAGSWNKILSTNDFDWCLILNDDIEFTLEQYRLILNLPDKHPGITAFAGHKYCAFMVSAASLKSVEYMPNKYFDEIFYPAYCEDVDFEWRYCLTNPGKYLRPVPELDPAVLRIKGSAPVSDLERKRNYKKQRKLFIAKWDTIPSKPPAQVRQARAVLLQDHGL